MLDSLCREPSRCPFAPLSAKNAFARTSPFSERGSSNPAKSRERTTSAVRRPLEHEALLDPVNSSIRSPDGRLVIDLKYFEPVVCQNTRQHSTETFFFV